MARRMKKADAAPEAGTIDAGELKRVVKEHAKQVGHASEYNGLAGQALKTFIERYGIDRHALRSGIALNKIDVQKRQARIRQTIEIWHKLGFFDQTDAFDDVLDRMDEIVTEVRGRSDERPAQDGALTSLTH